MPDNQVEIVFRTTAELQGALAAQAELEKTRGKLLALGKDTLEVDAQLARANQLVAQAPPEMLQAAQLEEQAEGFGKLTLRGREFHHVLHEVSSTSPAAGAALRAFVNPASAALFGLVLAVRAVHEAWKEYQKSLELGGKWEDLSKVTDAQAAAFNEASSSADAFARKLTEVTAEEQKLKQATEESIALIQERAREEDAERSADLAQKKAEIDAKRKAGIIDEVEALKEKNELENQFAREKVERENKAAQDVIAARQQQQAQTRALIPGAEKEAAGAEREFLLTEAPGVTRAKIERARANAKAAQEELEKAKEADASVFATAKDETRLENARLAAKRSQEYLEAQVAAAADLEEKYKLRKEKLERARAHLLDIRKLEADLGEDLSRSELLESRRAGSRARVESTQERTRALGVVGEISPLISKTAAGITPSPYAGTREEPGEPSAAQREAFRQLGVSMSDAIAPLILKSVQDAAEAAQRRTEMILSNGKTTQN